MATSEKGSVPQSSMRDTDEVMSGGYRVNLADGSALHLLTTRGTDPWIRQLAGIMHLEGLRDVLEAEEPVGAVGVCHLSSVHMYPQVEKRGVLTLRSSGNGVHAISAIGEPEHGKLNLEVIWRSFYPFYEHLMGQGGLPIHGALVVCDDRTVVVAGPAGGGKSTLCRRLPSGWVPVCDEEAVAVRVSDGGYRVHPFPTWSDIVERKLDRTWDVQRHYPLSAIFFLERGEIDCAEPVGVGEAALYLNRRAREKCFLYDWRLEHHEERAFRQGLFDNVCRLAATIPAFRLVVSKHGSFWEEMERVMP